MSELNMKASDQANEWARKKKQQMEKAKQLREERKQSSVLKSTGEQFMQKNVSSANQTAQNGSNAQYSNQKSSVSQQHLQYQPSPQTVSTTSSVGFQNYHKYGNDSQQQMSGNQFSPQTNNEFTTISSGFDVNNSHQKPQSNQKWSAAADQHTAIRASAGGGIGGGPLGNQTRTQENYYRPQEQQSPLLYGGNGSSQQQQNMTAFNNGFQGAKINYNHGSDNSQYSQEGSSSSGAAVKRRQSYSRKDLEDARSNLKFLKNRLNSKNNDRGTVYSTVNASRVDNDYSRDEGGAADDQYQPQSNFRQNRDINQSNISIGGGGGGGSRANRPPSGLTNHSSISNQQYPSSESGSNGGHHHSNQNYRKAFKPQIQGNDDNASGGGYIENLDKINQLVLNGGNVNLTRQSINAQQKGSGAAQYEPERRQQPGRRVTGDSQVLAQGDQKNNGIYSQNNNNRSQHQYDEDQHYGNQYQMQSSSANQNTGRFMGGTQEEDYGHQQQQSKTRPKPIAQLHQLTQQQQQQQQKYGNSGIGNNGVGGGYYGGRNNGEGGVEEDDDNEQIYTNTGLQTFTKKTNQKQPNADTFNPSSYKASGNVASSKYQNPISNSNNGNSRFNDNHASDDHNNRDYDEDDDGGQQDEGQEKELQLDRIECQSCGRKFVEKALARHQKICQKVFVQKRKQFDVKQQRQVIDETKQDDFGYKPKKPTKQAVAKKANVDKKHSEQPVGPSGGVPKWKAQSEMFRAAMKGTKATTDSNGVAMPAQPQAQQYDDRVECKFCNRKFADLTAQRHIPVCELKFKAQQMKVKGGGSSTTNKMGATGMGGAQNKRATSIGFRKQ